VVDDSGEIITGASVRLFRYASDRSTLEEIERWPIPELTDDLGEFRLFGVQSGAVFLSVEAPSPTGFGTVIALYPGVLSLAEAQPIQLRPGEEVSGLTVTIGRAKTASLSVVLRTPDGQVAAGESVTLQGPVPGGSRSRQQRSRTDGTTRFPNVAAGEYIVAVYKNPPSNLVAKARVVMDGDDVVLPLTVRTPDSLRGRFVSDTGAPLPEIRPRSSSVATSILTALESPNHTSPTFSVRADGRFEATDLNGRYMFWPGSPHSDWAVKSVRIAGADVTDAPFEFNGQDIDGVEVVLTQRISTLVVSVSELAGDSTLLGGGVLVFAEDATKWGTGRWAVNRFVRAADVFGGRSSIRLPPARYLVVALDDLSLGYDGGDRTHLLERLRPIATAVTLEEGESKSIEVPMLSVP
jgi:hypothetical protein